MKKKLLTRFLCNSIIAFESCNSIIAFELSFESLMHEMFSKYVKYVDINVID